MAADKSKFKIRYEQDAGFKYIVLEANGVYSQIPDKITQLMQLTAEQNLFPQMKGPIFTMFYNDPREAETEDEYHWAVGYPCAENAKVKAPLKKKERGESFVAKITVYGPYEDLAVQYEKIEEKIIADGHKILRFSLEMYLDDPRQVKPENTRTELWIDLKK
nr:GyrI-like domain-containing protein [Candidatus Freyarchaeota archaeon]